MVGVGGTGSLMHVGPDFRGLYSTAAEKGRPFFLAEFCPAMGVVVVVVVYGSQPRPRGGGSGSSSLMQIVKAEGW